MTDVDLAAGRLDAFIARLQRLDLEDLRLLALPLPDPRERAALLENVDRVAAEAGRTALVNEARERARKAIATAYDRHMYDPTWVGLNWGRSLGTTKDRLGLIVAAEDAAIAAVMSDLLDEDLAASLAEPFEHAAGMAGSTTTPSLSLDRPGPQGWLVRIVFGTMLVVAALVIGAVEAAVGMIAAILAGRGRRASCVARPRRDSGHRRRRETRPVLRARGRSVRQPAYSQRRPPVGPPREWPILDPGVLRGRFAALIREDRVGQRPLLSGNSLILPITSSRRVEPSTE